jgi:hypothetical protein
LATHLEQVSGIKLSGSQVRRRLSRKKYVYLWAKYSLEDKQNPEKRQIFKAIESRTFTGMVLGR